MLKRGGRKVTDIRLHCSFEHRIIFIAFFGGEKIIGEKEMIGDFLTRESFFRCFVALGKILMLCGYTDYKKIKLYESPINNFFVYRLPEDATNRYLRIKELPIKRITLECPQAARLIKIGYYSRDPEQVDQDFLIEVGEEKIENIPTLIDYEFLASAIHQLLMLLHGYKETEPRCRFNPSFPDYYAFEYQRFRKNPSP